jgi:hypothetical protein
MTTRRVILIVVALALVLATTASVAVAAPQNPRGAVVLEPINCRECAGKVSPSRKAGTGRRTRRIAQTWSSRI